MSKIAIIGAGTGGCLTVNHFFNYTDWTIDWYFDSNIKPQPVGEGSTLELPYALWRGLGFTFYDIEKIDGSCKFGIRKLNWGLKNKDFTHFFPPGKYALHFNASRLQSHFMQKMQSSNRIRIFDQNIKSPSDVDADYVMFCSGKPASYDDYHISNCIPVNSVHVTQCWWDHARFNYTLCVARPYGWVFGIPLTNRCSVGYMYNNKFATLDQVKDDVKTIFQDFNLTPSDTTNSFSFGNYYRKKNFIDQRVGYNGNASFFLEPLEATSINTIEYTNKLAFDLWVENHSLSEINARYIKKLKEVENVIALHYASGSTFNNDFWTYAKKICSENIEESIKTNNEFRNVISYAMQQDPTKNYPNTPDKINYGSWSGFSWSTNLYDLGWKLIDYKSRVNSN